MAPEQLGERILIPEGNGGDEVQIGPVGDVGDATVVIGVESGVIASPATIRPGGRTRPSLCVSQAPRVSHGGDPKIPSGPLTIHRRAWRFWTWVVTRHTHP
jgi:hypothetical protein